MLITAAPTSLILGQTKATTGDGKIVLLKEDGTWSYEKTDEEVQSSEIVFRNSSWGDSKEKVKASETAEFTIEDKVGDGTEYVAFKTDVANLATLVAYYFVQDKLYRSRYIFQDKHSNRNDYISDYSKIKKILINKYGEPYKSDVIWKNDLYQGKRQDYGMAIAVGHLIYYAQWKDNDTDINLMLSGGNYKIQHGVEYVDSELLKLAKKAKEDKNISDF